MNRWQHWQFTRAKQQAFLEDFTALVRDGVTPSQAIDTIVKINQGIVQTVGLDIAQSLAKGKGIAEGMQTWFSLPIVELVRAGETGANFPETLQAAIASYSQQSSYWALVIQSLSYPLLVFILALILLVALKNTVFTNFAQIKPVENWPMVGQNLWHFANFIQSWIWLFVLMLAGLVYSVIELLKQYTGKYRHFIDKIPVFSLYKSTKAAECMQTLGLLLQNGVMLKKALSVMHVLSSPYLAWHLLMMEYRLSGGKENLADVLDTQLIAQEDIVRLKVVAQSKGFSEALLKLGQQANLRNIKKIHRSVKLFSASLLILDAFIAANIVLSIYAVGSVVAN